MAFMFLRVNNCLLCYSSREMNMGHLFNIKFKMFADYNQEMGDDGDFIVPRL